MISRRWAIAGAIVGALLAVAAGISIWRELHPLNGSASGEQNSSIPESMLTQNPDDPPRAGQLRVDLGFEPESVTVGQPFNAALRVTAPPGVRIEYGEFTTNDSVQAIAPVQLGDTVAGAVVAVYPLVAWVAGGSLNDSVSIRIVHTDGTVRSQRIRLALPGVSSVLPAGAELSEIPPRPVKDVFVPTGADSWPWRWWLAALLAAIGAALLYWWMKRERLEVQQNEPADPAEWALGQLAGIQLASDASPAEIVLVYRRSSSILRGYLFRIHDNLGLDLTTSELAERARSVEMDVETRHALRSLLDSADRVKFAGLVPPVSEAVGAVESTRAWIVEYSGAGVKPGESPQRAA